MKKKLIRNLALNLSFFQLFAGSITAKAENKDHSDTGIIKSRYELVKDDDLNPIYVRVDHKTGETSPISIFDPDNIYTNQYGANQQDFRDRFRQIIKEPVIWNEMQKYYPVENFTDIDEALYFYELYFDIIYDCGCGYAVAANYIFHIFEGREEEFYDTFGFPMYVIKNNVIDFNYEAIMLELFNYNNLKIHNRYQDIKKVTEKDMLKYKVKIFKSKNILLVPDRDTAIQEDWNAWYNQGHEIEKKEKELKKKVAETAKEDIYFGIYCETVFGNIQSFLANYGISISPKHAYGLGKPNVDDIIASDKFTLYQTNKHGNVFRSDKIDLHYVYITDIKDDGTIIVSSWGEMYILDTKGATNTEKIMLKLSK